ncbi:hypothetical protein V8G54_007290 [Vigna mungo]|uniref:Uncharacterized protein n=1 Tax=Vigna mungo TaxID=3915 RepID=A0AAQ3S854_VIGMU
MLPIISRQQINSITKFTPIVVSHFKFLNVIFHPFLLFNCCPFSNNGTLFSTSTLFKNGAAFTAPAPPTEGFRKPTNLSNIVYRTDLTIKLIKLQHCFVHFFFKISSNILF